MKLAAAPGRSSRPETYVSGGLHGRRTGYCLAKGYTIAKGAIIEPLFLFNSHSANIRDHGRSTESSRAQLEKRQKEVGQRRCFHFSVIAYVAQGNHVLRLLTNEFLK